MGNIELETHRVYSWLTVGRGIFILRYSSAGCPREFPVAEIHQPADPDRRAQLVGMPGASTSELRQPGDVIVVVADKPTSLIVALRAACPGGSLSAVIDLQPVSATALASAAASPPSSRPEANAHPPMQFDWIAHITRRGDVRTAAGEWAAGPASPAIIEGLQVLPMADPSLTIETQALVADPAPNWGPWTSAGDFVGSRGRSLGILGLRFRLAGALAAGLEIVGEACFLGGPLQTRRGREIEFGAGSTMDPLVGLRLQLMPSRSSTLADRPQTGGSPLGKVKIYRSGSARAAA